MIRASNPVLPQTETARPSVLPDLKSNPMLRAVSIGQQLLVSTHVPRNLKSSKLALMQDFASALGHLKLDRAIVAGAISANVSNWPIACNPLVNGKRHGTRRTPQFNERIISLVPRTASRCVFSGLQRSR